MGCRDGRGSAAVVGRRVGLRLGKRRRKLAVVEGVGRLGIGRERGERSGGWDWREVGDWEVV